MQAADYWRNWQPGQKNIQEPLQTKLPKLTETGSDDSSVSSVNSKVTHIPIIPPSSSMTHPDPAAWNEDFDRWIKERCISREGCEDYGGVGALHRDFTEWSLSVGEVPATREVFERLLRAAGWTITNYYLVAGLVLRSDLHYALKLK